MSERLIAHSEGSSVTASETRADLGDPVRVTPDVAAVTAGRRRGRRLPQRLGIAAALAAVYIGVPYYLDSFWLNVGAFAAAAAIGAIGLTVLYGRVGQLSLAHSFFLAVGAYGYILLAADPEDGLWGLGLPGVVAAAGAIVLAGLAGGLFSPIAGRLKGISLGVATIALVFIGEHILLSVPGLSGGFNGRNVPELAIGGFELVGDDPSLTIAGVLIGRTERMWLLCVLCLGAASWFTARVLSSRIGRAFVAVRDGEVQAAALGIDVARTRAAAFIFSSALAGLAGVLLAVAFRRVVPEYWSLILALQFLAMVVLGGLGSIRGAIAGALFVTSLPLLLQRYGASIPGLGTDPGAAFPPSVVAQISYGLLIVIVLLIDPKGLAEIARRLGRALVRRPR